MVIDYILDRKDGYGYDVKEFYDACMAYEEFDIARALDSGTEKDVKKALCNYVIDNDYSKSICKYINSENWLEGFEESKKSARKSIKESSFSFVTVNDFCKHCATNYKHCEIWSVDGHHKYDEFDNLNKSNKSPYKYHEIMMWDVQNDTIILYIENNALAF